MADNFLEKQYDAAFGKDAGRESVSVRHGLVIRRKGGKIVSVKRQTEASPCGSSPETKARQDPRKAR